MVALGSVMLKLCALFCFLGSVAAQKLASFDAASASSVFSTKSFGAELAARESSGYSKLILGPMRRACVSLGPGIGAAQGKNFVD